MNLQPLEPLPPMAWQPGSAGVLIDLRAGADGLEEVAEAALQLARSESWRGVTAQAARSAATSYSAAVGRLVAEWEGVAVALASYLQAMGERQAEWHDLNDHAVAINRDVELLTEPDPARAAVLRSRQLGWSRDRAAWAHRVETDEDVLIAALEGRSSPEVPSVAVPLAVLPFMHDPVAVHAWWTRLSPAQQEVVLTTAPDQIGNTDGVPAIARDAANRAALLDDLAALTDGHALSRARATAAALGLAAGAMLLAYRPFAFGGDGSGAVAYGDPDSADHTAVLVPGFTSDLRSMDDLGPKALAVHTASGGSVAAIAWMGYDAPDFSPASALDLPGSAADALGVVDETKAVDGGHRLAAFVAGLHATHAPGTANHVTVIGHSYGSTTAAHAARDGLAVENLVLIGSPGAGHGVHHAVDLGVPQVWVGSRRNDFVTWLGGDHPGGAGLGVDPAQSGFGGTDFDVTGGFTDAGHWHHDETLFDRPFHAEQVLSAGVAVHNSYFAPGSDSLLNLARIADGETPIDYGAIGGGPRHTSAESYLTDWLLREGTRPLPWP